MEGKAGDLGDPDIKPNSPAIPEAATGDLPARDDPDTASDPDDAFDRLLQDQIARSSDLMRQALALQGRTEQQIARARAETDRRLDQERQQQRAVLTAVAAQVTDLRVALDLLAQRLDDALAATSPAQRRSAKPTASAPPNQSPVEETFDQASATAARADAAVSGAPLAAVADDQPTPPPQTAEPPTSVTNVTVADGTPLIEPHAADAAGATHQMTVLVHGVPRAAAALSLQRHLAALPHVEGVEAREYAEGILRLQVTTRQPLALDDLQTWEGGTGLEPVHVQPDVIEVRLPGAVGF